MQKFPGTAGEATRVPATRCIFVSGTDLAAFVGAAKSADVLTIWSFGSARYSVAVRPVYPDESGCPAA